MFSFRSALVVCSFISSISFIEAYVRWDDLLVYYTMDDGAGSDVEDFSDNDFDGSMVGMDDADWVDAKFGKGLEFEGGDDRVKIPTSVPVSFHKSTISVWVKTSHSFTDAGHIYYGSTSGNGDGFGGELEYHLNFTANSNKVQYFIIGTSRVDRSTTPVLNDDTWHHLVAVNQPGEFTLYVDGGNTAKLVDTDTPEEFFFTGAHQLGGPSANRRPFVGIIDDFRIYDVSLTEAEVVELYNDGNGDLSEKPVVVLNGDSSVRIEAGGVYTEEGATATDPEDGDLTVHIAYQGPLAGGPTQATHLKGWWKMEDDATDSSGVGNDGVLIGDASFVDGKFGKALSLDGDGDALDVANFTGINSSSQFTVSVWANLVTLGQSSADDGALFSNVGNSALLWANYDATTAPIPMSMSYNVGDISDNSNRVDGPADLLVDNVWHHVVGVMDGAIRKIYVDGLMVAEVTNSAQQSITIDGEQVQVGGWDNHSNQWFNGMVDDVRVYDVALTDEEVSTIFNNGDGETILPPPTTVDTSIVGDWKVIYSATDSIHQTVSVERNVRVFDPQAPVITLTDGLVLNHEIGTDYSEPTAIVRDAEGNELNASSIIRVSNVDPDALGSYSISYDFTDSEGLPAETLIQTVNVVDTTAPTLTFVVGDVIKHPIGQPFRDPGVSAEDYVDGVFHPESSLYVHNQLLRRGYLAGANERFLMFDNNGGLIASNPDGEVLQTKAINLNGDAAFRADAPFINRNDSYRNLFIGYFLAKKDGEYEMGMEGPNDRGVVWIDLDQDGVFEFLGNNGSEMITPGYWGGYKILNLKAGYYRYAVGHLEGSGTAAVNPRFYTPEGAGPTTRSTVHPADPEQDGLWSTSQFFDIHNPGTHLITYTATDSSGNVSTLTRTVEVGDFEELPVITLLGQPVVTHPAGEDYTDAGVTVADSNGEEVPSPAVLIYGAVNKDVPGEYRIEYRFTDPNGGYSAIPVFRRVIVSDKVPPVITLLGDLEIEHIQGQPFVDPGVEGEDNFDGDLAVGSTASIPVNGLWLHFDASQIQAENGEVLTIWPDISGNDRHFDYVRGDPTLAVDALNGKPAVRLDGDDRMAITPNLGNTYTILTISQLEGTQNDRLISSFDVNWLLGYNNNFRDVFHPNGWATPSYGEPADTDPHLYTATSTGSSDVRFFADGLDKTWYSNRNSSVNRLQIGAYRESDDMSKGDVAEIIVYDRVLDESERLSVEGYLASKYRLLGTPEYNLPDFNELGEHTILYLAQDRAGNRTYATRTVTVVPDPEAPRIVLSTELDLIHEAGTVFTEPTVQVLDKDDGELDLADLATSGTVDPNSVGTYLVEYTYAPAQGLAAVPVTLKVTVLDTTPPSLTLNGEGTVVLNVGDAYTEAGADATDLVSGDLSVAVEHTRPIYDWEPGLLEGTLSGASSRDENPGDRGVDPLGPTNSEVTSKPPWADNSSIVYTGQIFDEDGLISFTEHVDDIVFLLVNGVEVLNDQTWDQRTSSTVDFGEGGWFDFKLWMGNATGGAGVTGNDFPGFGYDPSGGTDFVAPTNSDASTMDLFRTGNPDFSKFDTSEPGSYDITYRAVDAEGNEATIVRKVVILPDNQTPYILLNGEQTVTLEALASATWVDPGAVAKAADGTVLDASLSGVGEVDPTTIGEYTLVYEFQDVNEVWAETVQRTIIVEDTQPPEITLNGEQFMTVFVNSTYSDPGAVGTDLADGNVDVFSDIGEIPNRLLAHTYVRNWAGRFFNFDQSNSLLSEVPNGSKLFTNGVHENGIFFISDGEFREVFPSITRNDNFNTIWTGRLHAPRDGEYVFQASNVNERGTIWLDKNQNEIWERAEGSHGDEQITWGNQTATLLLSKGSYNIAIGHSEDGGTSSFRASIQTPDGAGPAFLTNIHPGDPMQEGLWSTIPGPGVDTSTPGRYKVNYFAVDLAGNQTTKQRIVIVEEDLERPVMFLVGDPDLQHQAGVPYEDPGVVLQDYLGNALDAGLVQVENLPTGMETGSFTITYHYTDPDGHIADGLTRLVEVRDTQSPELTIVGANPLTIGVGQEFVDPGAAVTDSFDNAVVLVKNIGMPTDGLVLHLDAGTLAATHNDGDEFTPPWNDLSGNDQHMDNKSGNPRWEDNVLNGHPVMEYDGDDLSWTTHNFEPDLEEYTIISVARYINGSHSRVISTRGRNWLFGFNSNGTGRFYAEGWVQNSGQNNNDWHLHAGDMNRSAQANFWKNEEQLSIDKFGANPSYYRPRVIQFGGWESNRDRSDCQVAEFLLYNRILSKTERLSITEHLQGKYNLNSGGTPYLTLDTSTEGEYDVVYTGIDASGNKIRATRKVVVVTDPQLPEITLLGDPTVEHTAGEIYTDPGATLADRTGQPVADPVFQTGSSVNADLPGTYSFTYDFTDGEGNAAVTAVRTVVVVDRSAPVISLIGSEIIEHQLGNPFIDPGFSAMDAVDGEVEVESSELRQNVILASVYTISGFSDNDLNLNNNEGLLLRPPLETVDYSRGPGNSGVYIDGDTRFRSVFTQLNQNDNFQLLFSGDFYTPTGGRYEFGIEGVDDRSTFWIDLDQDGVFENLGDQGGELMNLGNIVGYQTVDLAPGFYRYAITFREGGGGSRIDARYRALQGYGPSTRTRIRPYEAQQDGSWVQYNPIPYNIPGEYRITYTATDHAGNEATLTRTVIVRNNPDAGVITLNGDSEIILPVGEDFVDPGFIVLDLDGNDLTTDGQSSITGSVNTQSVGDYIVTYSFVSNDGVPARDVQRIVQVRDIEAPVITLIGEEELNIFQGQDFVDPGATAHDNYDGNLGVGTSQNVETSGLILHLDASAIVGLEDGDNVNLWYDQSGSQNDANVVTGSPKYRSSGIGGKPSIFFDGLSSLHTTHSFGNQYSIITVSRLEGISNQRLLSSFNENWILGYNDGDQDVFHPVNGWVTDNHPLATTNPNIFTATSTGSNEVYFYANGRNKTLVSRRNGNIGQFKMGAYRNMEFPAVGEVAEVIIYDRVLTLSEHMSLEALLNAKYSMNGVVSDPVPVDVNTLGTYSVVYQAIDGAGNLSSKVRTIHVVPDPNAPAITLEGDLVIQHEKGEPFVEPGFVLEDSEGDVLDDSLVSISGVVDVHESAQYVIRYNYRPERGSPAAEVTRVVNVTDSLAPVITLNGDTVVKLEIGEAWTDPGATAQDQGDGTAYVVSDLEWNLGQLQKQGYKFDPSQDSYLDLNANGGLLAEKSLGIGIMTTGPGDNGFDFNNRDDFWAGIVDVDGDPVPSQNDRFQILFTGSFIAPVAGDYELGIISQDDRTSIWLDLDRDGIFEDAGDRGNEQVQAANQGGFGQVTLEPGPYNFAAAYREGTGGENTELGMSVLGGNIPYHRQRIDLVSDRQRTFWGMPGSPLDTSVAGTYLITYSAQDLSGHVSTVTRTVVVVDDASLPLLSLNGDPVIFHEAGTPFEDPGATVTDANDVDVETDLKSLDALDVNTLGSQIINYTYTDGDGKVAAPISRNVTVVDTLPPVISLKPHPVSGETNVIHLTVGQSWEDPGVELTDFDASPWFVSSRDYIPNQLQMYGFTRTPANSLLDFNNNGGLMNESADGHFLFKQGPFGRGYDFRSDADFRRLPIGITQDDHFLSYVTGYFFAKVHGDYSFRIDNVDDYMSLWLDLDQDGLFENSGDSGDEELVFGQGGVKTVTLAEGQYYKIAIGHLEWSSGSRARFRFTTPGETNPSGEVIMNPSLPDQNGLWLTAGDGAIDPNVPGTYEITYYAMDVHGHVSTANRTVVIEIDPDAPILELVGSPEMHVELGTAFVDEGVLAKTNAGDSIPNPEIDQTITRNGFSANEVDVATPGVYEIVYGYTDAQSRVAVPVKRIVTVADTTPPVISLNGSSQVTVPPGAMYNDEGATALDAVDGNVTVVLTSSKPDGRYVPGLILGNMAGNISSASNPKNSGVDPLGPTMAYSDQKPPWRDNRTFVYTGEIYDADGVISFREHIDDKVILDVGSIPNVLNDASAGNATENAIDLGQGGWFPFELRMSNGSGNGGQVAAPGFGYDSEGGTNYAEALNSDPTTMNLFRYLSHPHDTVDTTIEGEYTITFTATDAAGNTATETRTVVVIDDLTLPIITLEGEEEITWEAGDPFVEPGFSVADRRGNSFDAADVTHDGDLVDTSMLQTFTITYNYTKDDQTAPAVRRRVSVVDTTPPEITLNNGSQIRLNTGATYIDAGAIVTDNYDTRLTYTSELLVEGLQPIAHWDFDQDDGTIARELMNSLDGTLTNFPTPEADSWVVGKYGKALKFDAANSSYVLIPGSDKLDLQAFTISVWINSGEYNSNMFLFEKTSNNTINSQYNLYFEDTQLLKFKTIGTDVSVNETTAPSSVLAINDWQHIAVTYDGSNKMIYLNGELQGTETHDITLETGATGPSYIGAFTPGDGYHFHGLMDDLKIYDVPVEESLITEIGKRSGIDTTNIKKEPYKIVYTSTDSNGNTATVTREIVVSNDTTPPTITLTGAAEINVALGEDFDDPGATADDNQDGDISALLVVSGEVDTSKVGSYTITYNVKDLSFNAANPVVRTVTVGDPQPSSPLEQWIADHLSTFEVAEQDLEADPDNDSMINLLEYALGGNPSSTDLDSVLPQIDHSSGSLRVTFLRLKPSVDSSITYKAELTNDLANTPWSEAEVTITVDADQNGVPAYYEKVTATANTSIAAETEGQQFIRIVVSNE